MAQKGWPVLQHNVKKTRAIMRDSYFSHKLPMEPANSYGPARLNCGTLKMFKQLQSRSWLASR